MSCGIAEISALAGIVTCSIQFLQGCIQGFLILSRARSYGRDVSGVRLMIELEQHKLCVWAEKAGLLAKDPKLQVGLQHAKFVPKVLGELQNLLCDVHKLRIEYGLDLEVTSEEIADLKIHESAFSKLGLGHKRRFETEEAEVFRRRRGPWHKLKWVTIDEQKIRGLLEQVKYFIGELQSFLEPDSGESLKNILDTLLRIAVMNSSNAHELHFIGQDTNDSLTISAVAAAAKLKERGVLLGGIDQVRLQNSVDNLASNYQRQSLSETRPPLRQSSTDVSGNNTLQSRRHQMRYLTLRERILLSEYRQLAWYDNEPVLLEWRSVDRSNSPRVEYRVDKASALLRELADPSFHSLACRGYIKDHESGRYGHVFELPYMAERSHRNIHTLHPRSRLPPLPAMRTLREMLSTPSACPSLNLRISYAIILFETILQLHTAGWLHKELRSENILFIQNSSTEPPSDQSLLRSKMYLAGYVYARADGPLEFTEPLESEAEADLYRHSLYLGNSRLAYRKSFDIFSIGCILLELGLWSSFAAVLRAYGQRKRPFASEHMTSTSSEHTTSSAPSLAFSPPSTPNRDDGALDLMRARCDILCSINSPTDMTDCNSIIGMLEAQMGATYTKVVVNCLRAETRENKPGGIDEHKCALELEKNSLAQLKRIAERI
jgi:hypothetical protein